MLEARLALRRVWKRLLRLPNLRRVELSASDELSVVGSEAAAAACV